MKCEGDIDFYEGRIFEFEQRTQIKKIELANFVKESSVFGLASLLEAQDNVQKNSSKIKTLLRKTKSSYENEINKKTDLQPYIKKFSEILYDTVNIFFLKRAYSETIAVGEVALRHCLKPLILLVKNDTKIPKKDRNNITSLLELRLIEMLNLLVRASDCLQDEEGVKKYIYEGLKLTDIATVGDVIPHMYSGESVENNWINNMQVSFYCYLFRSTLRQLKKDKSFFSENLNQLENLLEEAKKKLSRQDNIHIYSIVSYQAGEYCLINNNYDRAVYWYEQALQYVQGGFGKEERIVEINKTLAFAKNKQEKINFLEKISNNLDEVKGELKENEKFILSCTNKNFDTRQYFQSTHPAIVIDHKKKSVSIDLKNITLKELENFINPLSKIYQQENNKWENFKEEKTIEGKEEKRKSRRYSAALFPPSPTPEKLSDLGFDKKYDEMPFHPIEGKRLSVGPKTFYGVYNKSLSPELDEETHKHFLAALKNNSIRVFRGKNGEMLFKISISSTSPHGDVRIGGTIQQTVITPTGKPIYLIEFGKAYTHKTQQKALYGCGK